MKTTYDSYKYADTLENFLKFLNKPDSQQSKDLKAEIKSLKSAERIIIKGK